MKKHTVISLGIILSVIFVLAGCGGTKTLGICPYEQEKFRGGIEEYSWRFSLRLPAGWEGASPAEGQINVGTESLPDELTLQLREDQGEMFTASQAVCRGDYDAFETVYGGFGYGNFQYQKYSGTHGNLIEVRYESNGVPFTEYFRADIPYSVSVNTSANWHTEDGTSLSEIALYTLDSLEIMW